MRAAATTLLLLLCSAPHARSLRLPHACPPTSAAAVRCPPPQCVSERHNLAYKESIKQFEPLAPEAPLHEIPFVSHVPGPDDGICNGDYLVHTTSVPLVTHRECEYVIEECERWAHAAGGWTSKRHFNHPTTDIPLAELPLTRQLLNEFVLPERIYPFLGNAFRRSLPNWRALRVADAFVVKYNASGGQTFLSPHRDGSVLSFNIALNERGEYTGGGTWFEQYGQALPIERGHVCCHASGVKHGGHPIGSGVRYILVGFVLVEGYQNWAMRFMKSVWDY